MHIAPSISSLSEASINFDTDDDSSYDVDDSAFEWNLADIYSDIEPAAQEIYRKFPYLQFKSPSSWNYLNTMRPQKPQNFRLPHPFQKSGSFSVSTTTIQLLVWIISLQSDSITIWMPSYRHFLKLKLTFIWWTIPIIRIWTILPCFFDKQNLYRCCNKSTSQLDCWQFFRITQFSNLWKRHGFLYTIFSGSFETFIQSQWYGDFTKIPSLPNTNRMIPSLPHFSQTSPYYLVEILTDAANRATSMRDYYKGCEYFNASQAMLKLLPHHTATNYHQVAYELNSSILRALKQNEEAFCPKCRRWLRSVTILLVLTKFICNKL